MKKILFIGPPGSGKGTQAKILERNGFKTIGTGNLIRNSTDPKIIRYREVEYLEGKLLSDKLIFGLIEKEILSLPKNCEGYILDGAIRNVEQAKYAREKGIVNLILYFSVDENTAIERILKRNGGRSDDNLISVKKRFEEYKEKTEPSLKYLKKNFEFHKIDASKTIEEVNKKVLKILKLRD